MDQLHLHLMLTHFPIVGAILGFLVLILGYLVRNSSVKKTALFIFIVSAVIAIPAFLTGEGAEEVAEKLPGVTDASIEAHEEIAEIYIWVIGALGVFSLITLALETFNNELKRIFYFITFIVALISIVISYRVGNFGGEIRHTELRNDAGTVILKKNKNKHDDD